MSASRQVLVAYYSLTGNTARVARDLAARLGADMECIRDERHGGGVLGQFVAAFDSWRRAPAHINALQHDPTEYAVTIVGTPVWTGRMTPAVRAYLEEARGRMKSAAFFVTSGETDIGKIVPSLEMAAGKAPIASAGFNAHELRDGIAYERKLASFVAQIKLACGLARRVA